MDSTTNLDPQWVTWSYGTIKKIKAGGEPLTATRVTNIAFKNTKEEPGIPMINHLLKAASDTENW